ncbi:MAG: TolB family protein [Actinomycetota bacterium]
MGSHRPTISDDGRYVAFNSCATDLVPGDTNLARDVFVSDTTTGIVRRVSVSSQGDQSSRSNPTAVLECSVGNHGISANGRFVAFASTADNLVPEDDNDAWDVFVHDRKTGKTEISSVSSRGKQGNGPSPGFGTFGEGGDEENPTPIAISADGLLVAFDSTADNLVPDDTNESRDIFVHNRVNGETERVSVASDGTEVVLEPALGTTTTPALSHDGRFVAFQSTSNQLVPNDARGALDSGDVFVHDRRTHRTEKVSVNWHGGQGIGFLGVSPGLYGNGWAVDISDNGRHVAFHATADGLVPGDDPSWAVCCPRTSSVVHDRFTGMLDIVSRAYDGSLPPCTLGTSPQSISPTGRYVTFFAHDDCMAVPHDTNSAMDVFVRDRGLPLSVGDLVASHQARSLSVDGVPAFARTGTVWIEDAVPDGLAPKLGQVGELLGARISYRPLLNDIYVVLELESMPRTPALAAVTAGAVYGMSFTLDGKAYEIRSASTGLGPNGKTTAAFGLFSCPDGAVLCTKVADLRGGFGTTGEGIVFSVPLDNLGVKDGSVISGVTAWTALGTFHGGATKSVDKATLKK